MALSTRSNPFPFACLAAVLLVAACDPAPTATNGSNNRTPVAGPPMFSVRYSLSPVAGEMWSFPDPDTSWDCDGTTLREWVDSFPAQLSGYRIDKDTLRFDIEVDSGGDIWGDDAVTEGWSDFVRVTGTSGLEGRWQAVAARYRVLSGTLGDRQRQELDRVQARQMNEYSLMIEEIEFRGDRIHWRADGRFAELFVSHWNGTYHHPGATPDSVAYAVDIKATGKMTVTMKGRKTGEAVTILFDTGGQTYSSDLAAHKSYRAARRGSKPDCLDPGRYWYQDFLDANTKPRPVDP